MGVLKNMFHSVIHGTEEPKKMPTTDWIHKTPSHGNKEQCIRRRRRIPVHKSQLTPAMGVVTGARPIASLLGNKTTSGGGPVRTKPDSNR